MLLHGGQNPSAAPRSRAGIAAAETARLLATGARANFREVVEDLADQARQSQPEGESGPIIAWSEASAAPPYGASLGLPRGSSPGPALRIGPLPRSPLRTAFQRASYSSLIRDKHAEGASVASPAEEDNGHDDPADDPLASTIGTPTKAWSALPDVPLARFVRGPAAGVFVHGLLERIDFRTGHERLGQVSRGG